MKPHLRVVSSREAPIPVQGMDTFRFAQVGGEMVALHNDEQCSMPEAVTRIMRLASFSVSSIPTEHPTVALRRVFPGHMGCGVEIPADQLDWPASFSNPPCALPSKPRPICAETDGDVS